MQIEVWSDIYCPWCYIGKRRLEKALSQFEHRDEVEIVWRSFQLDPEATNDFDGSINDYLSEKKGISPARAEAMHAQLTGLAAQDGLEYHFEKVHPGNSLDAHRVLHLAAEHNVQDAMKERLMRAYFTEGRSVSDHDTLVELAAEAGLPADEVRQMLASDRYVTDVHADIRRAMGFGVRGVPFFAFDEKFAVSGAQPVELFQQALERAWQESHPLIQLVGNDNASVCTDDVCEV